MMADIATRTLSSRVVLLCMADLELTDSAPAHTGEIVRETKGCLDTVDADTLGKLSEAEVNRTLNRLEADGLVEMDRPDNTSPTGKGRPRYSLDIDPDEVVSALSEDEDVARLAKRIEGERS
jgi:predicted transcriptional regulator